jgi:hypothetical protein
LRHGPAHPSQGFRRPRPGQAVGGTLDVGARNGSFGPARLDAIEIDIELSRQGPHGRQNVKWLRPCRFTQCLRRLALLVPPKLADHCAGIRFRPFRELNQGRTHLRNPSEAGH